MTFFNTKSTYDNLYILNYEMKTWEALAWLRQLYDHGKKQIQIKTNFFFL